MKFIIVLLFMFVLYLPVYALQTQNAYVEKVISGNKIELSTGDVIEYIGVNIPIDSSNLIFKSALELNKKLVESKIIKLELDEKENNDVGCLLAYVYCGDIFVNAEIIRQGYGIINIHSPNIKYAELLVKAERDARDQKRGFWSEQKENLAENEHISIEKQILKLSAKFDELNKKVDQLIELVNALILRIDNLSVKTENIPEINEKQDIKQAKSNSNDTIVYITKSGKKYHRPGCRFLGENPIAITIEEAKQKGYQPCKTCFPDQ